MTNLDTINKVIKTSTILWIISLVLIIVIFLSIPKRHSDTNHLKTIGVLLILASIFSILNGIFNEKKRKMEEDKAHKFDKSINILSIIGGFILAIITIFIFINDKFKLIQNNNVEYINIAFLSIGALLWLITVFMRISKKKDKNNTSEKVRTTARAR